jgi:hypothetical protein
VKAAPLRDDDDVAAEQVLLEFPHPLTPVTAVRSTLITSSLASLRQRGLFERYDQLQRTPHRERLLSCVAGEWLDIAVARAHYSVCDALGLSRNEQIAIGKDVSKLIHETFLRLIVSAARGVGVTPWAILRRGDSLQARLNQGGGMRLLRLSEQSARIELAQNSLFEVPYFRNAVLGVYAAGVEILASNVSARIILDESRRPGELLVLRLDWSEV